MPHPRFSGEEITRGVRNCMTRHRRPLVETPDNIGKMCPSTSRQATMKLGMTDHDRRSMLPVSGRSTFGARIGYSASIRGSAVSALGLRLRHSR